MKNRANRISEKNKDYARFLFFKALRGILFFGFNRKEKDFIFFTKLISDHGIILDLGANIGIRTHYLATNKPDSIIYTFEPAAEYNTALRKIIKLFKLKNIRVMEMALGDKNGTTEMQIGKQTEIEQAKYNLKKSPLSESNSELEKILVPIRRLDSMDIFSLSKYFINGIKLDVGKFDFLVLKGAHLLLQRHRPIVYAEIKDAQNRQQCFDLMDGYGYDINVLINNKLVPFDQKIHQKQIFFFVPED